MGDRRWQPTVADGRTLVTTGSSPTRAREFDPQKRFDIFRRAEEMLISEGTPICPLYYYVGIQLYDGNRLGGVQGNVLDEHPIREMYGSNNGPSLFACR